jgi:hypothetical protein
MRKNEQVQKLRSLVFFAAIALMAVAAEPASAQERTLSVRVNVASESAKVLAERPVMVSVIKDGQLIKQSEIQLNSSAYFALPGGIYDIRVEGEGMQTLVKRGILVKNGEEMWAIGGPMRAGTGVKVIEYATTGLSREEIAARLAKLEAAVAALQKPR